MSLVSDCMLIEMTYECWLLIVGRGLSHEWRSRCSTLSEHRISAGRRIDDSRGARGRSVRMRPGRVGGGALIFTGALSSLPTCLNPPKPVQDSLEILYHIRHSWVSEGLDRGIRRVLLRMRG